MKKLHLSHKKVQRMVKNIADCMKEDNWQPDYIVGITRGGLLPATLLSQYLGTPMYSLDVSLRDTNDMGPTTNAWMAEDAFNGKNILIVDDINDSGATLQWIKNDWKASCVPDSPKWQTVYGTSLRIATLVENKSSEFKDVTYAGRVINKAKKDVWVVFPWEDWW